MKLKHAILEVLGRDDLKKICKDFDVEDVDQRSAEAMTAKLSRAHRATAEKLIVYLSEAEVREVAERVGAVVRGRRTELIEALLRRERAYPGADPAQPAGWVQDREQTAASTDIVGPQIQDGPAQAYRHTQTAVQRPDAGLQDQFQARKPAKTYRYDSSLDPALSWDEQRERELGDWLLGLIERAAKEGEQAVFATRREWKGGGVSVASTTDAIAFLKQISKPFLTWAGKAERQEIRVPTVPLFVHERHSTKAVLDGIRHRKAKGTSLDLFGDAQMEIGDRLDAYEHKGPWQNRMILGDSLQVMNSLLEYEGLGGQVQMIYIDPPYGVKFGSNFQPFVRKNTVKDGADADFTREPEMVKAYRDTWELGLHSYLTYLRDRLLLARDLLTDSGSVFVQISSENLHHVREVVDEVFGADNFLNVIPFAKTSGVTTRFLASNVDFLLWVARDRGRAHFSDVYVPKSFDEGTADNYTWLMFPDGTHRGMTAEERRDRTKAPEQARVYKPDNIASQGNPSPEFTYRGKVYKQAWKTTIRGLERLAKAGRLHVAKNSLQYVRYLTDFPCVPITQLWEDTQTGSFTEEKIYSVQTAKKVIERCVLMTTVPGDLVFDPTCGSGTTAYVAEQWGRRWITCDTSRVPLALARQRLLTSTFPYYELKDPKAGPRGGFVYKRKQNRKGDEIGGLVPHITLKSIANDEPPKMEVLVDRPEPLPSVTRVSGPFAVEATVAPAQTIDEPEENGGAADSSAHLERMTGLLRQSKTLHLQGNRTLELRGIRRLTDAEYLHAEAKDGEKRIAIVFGPEDGALTQRVVYDAASEALYLKYGQIFFFGFAIEPEARRMIEDERKLRMRAMYVAVTPDVSMSDLLKTTRASEIFSITGLPDFDLRPAKSKMAGGEPLYQVELKGLDIFDPGSLNTESVEGSAVPCWILDTDYDGMCFYATQVFFPKTSAWDNLQKSLNANFDDSVWQHLAGTVSEPFALGSRRKVAVKVIDERGNELMRVKDVP